MRKLPHWCLTDKFPGFYDTESSSAISQTAKLYKAMQELIEEYNLFADETNKALEEFEQETTDRIECFKKCMVETMKNHIDVIDTKMLHQDKVIADASTYMKENIYINTYNVVDEMFKSGLVKLQATYNAAEESLSFDLTTGEEV